MNDIESHSSLSDLMQNLELSQYSTSLAQEINEALSSYNSSEILGSPQSGKSKIFLSPLHGDDSLKSQLKQRDNIIDAMRLKYNRTISQLTDKLVQTNADIAQIKQQYKEKIDEMRNKSNQAQSDQETQLRNEIDKLKAQNRARRDNLTFSRLPEIDDEEYSKLKSEKQSNLSIPQFVAIQLFEHDMEFKDKIAAAQKLRDEALKKMEKLHSKLESESTNLVSERELRISLEQKLASLTVKGLSTKQIPPEASTYNEQKVRKLEEENNELRNSCQVALNRCT